MTITDVPKFMLPTIPSKVSVSIRRPTIWRTVISPSVTTSDNPVATIILYRD